MIKQREYNIVLCSGYLCTFTSTSWDINVAKKFCSSKEMIVAFASDSRQFGCDVSWISLFGDSEREILFTRGNLWGQFKLISMNDSKQYVVFGEGDKIQKIF